MTNVLVTGGSGFIAGHVIIRLLADGHTVRATLRSLDKESQVRDTLAAEGTEHLDRLTFTAADLLADDGWAAAMAGIDDVIHVASPVQTDNVTDEDAVVRPAVDGTLRVLRAARDAGIRRVVLTSAFHAVGYGVRRSDHLFTEADWSPLDGPGMTPYGRSKVLAERAAWDFVAENPGLELATILPVAVMGPVLGRDVSGANHVIQNMLTGEFAAIPDMYIPIVDVRDVAAAHVLAMTTPDAAGRRYLVGNGTTMPLRDVAALLRDRLGEAAARVTRRHVPSLVVRLAAIVRPEFRPVRADLGFARQVSNARAREVLGWSGRPPEESILAAASSMIAKGLVG